MNTKPERTPPKWIEASVELFDHKPKFRPGDLIRKPVGYSFNGVVRAVFATSANEVRVVGELSGRNGGGMLHIFSEAQLEHRKARKK